jgi:glycosyltransferase involved in cell wall biosynthesis
MSLISVVIPAFNVADTIGEQLAALSRQTYQGSWEVVVADNGSSDGPRLVVERFTDALPEVRVVDASARRGAAVARNAGAEAARGSYLAFCDADDVVSDRWLENCVKALTEHDFVAGAIDHDTINPGDTSVWHFRSHVDRAPIGLGFLPYALSSNLAVNRRAFEKVGGFPEDLDIPAGAAGEDIALSFRLQLGGYPLHFEPEAVVAYRHRQDLRSLWHQQVAYGFAEPVLYKRFRDAGVPRPRPLSFLKAYGKLVWRLPWLLQSSKRVAWILSAAKRWGRLRGSLHQRVLYL